MTNLYDVFGTDPELESTKGVWIDYGKSTSIKIARAGGANKAYQAALLKLSNEYKHQIQSEVLGEEVAGTLMLEVFVDTIILDWEGIKDKNGEEMPFTKENARKLLTDLPDLFIDLRQMAGNITLFREKIIEDDGKNS